MIVVGARVEPFALALRRPLVTARGTIAERHGFLLRLVGADGGAGRGEASPAYWLGEGTLEETAACLERVVALVRTRPPLAWMRGRLEDDALGLAPAAAAALDAALLDLEARACGVAAAALLGGAPAAPRVAVAALVGGTDAAAVGDDAAAAVARGYRTVKLKVGGGPLADDVARVAAVRRRIGPAAALRLDANRAWTIAEAERALAALAPYDAAYVEEPLRDADPAALAALAAATAVPLAVDESLRDPGDLARLVAAGARVHVVLKAARVGGPTRLVALGRAAAAAGLPVVVTDGIESRVGMAVAVHAAAALAVPNAVGLGGAQLAPAEDVLRAPALVARGPGLDVAPVAAATGGCEGARA